MWHCQCWIHCVKFVGTQSWTANLNKSISLHMHHIWYNIYNVSDLCFSTFWAFWVQIFIKNMKGHCRMISFLSVVNTFLSYSDVLQSVMPVLLSHYLWRSPPCMLAFVIVLGKKIEKKYMMLALHSQKNLCFIPRLQWIK